MESRATRLFEPSEKSKAATDPKWPKTDPPEMAEIVFWPLLFWIAPIFFFISIDPGFSAYNAKPLCPGYGVCNSSDVVTALIQ